MKPKSPPKKVRFQTYYRYNSHLEKKSAAANGSESGDGMSDSELAYKLERKAKIRANKTIQPAFLCKVYVMYV